MADPGATSETGCTTGTCSSLLTSPDCAWLTYPSGGPNEKSCKTAQPFTIALNNCFKDIDSLAYVIVIAPAATGTCTKYGPGGTQDYKNGSAIAEVQLKCGQDVLIFAKGMPDGASSTVTGTRKNPPAGCRGTGGSTGLCDTCRFRPSVSTPDAFARKYMWRLCLPYRCAADPLPACCAAPHPAEELVGCLMSDCC